MQIERETNHERFLATENNLRVAGGEVGGEMGNRVMGMKEGMWCNEHWVLYATDESLNYTSETNKHYMLIKLNWNKF